MKKYFMLLAAAATVLAVSCAKEKAQPTTDPTPDNQEELTGPMPIRFGTSSMEVKSPITKAAIEKIGDNKGWKATDSLYIYGFSVDGNGAIDFSKAPIINNVGAKAPTKTPGTDQSAFDGDRDSIYVYKNPATKEYFYYGEDVYNFYGYFVGSVMAAPQPTINATDKVVTLPLEGLDGTQDIMLAATDKFADYLAASSPSVSLEKIYSEVSARKNVTPDLLFKHQLARFKFEAKYGGTGASAATEAANIKIDTIGIDAFTKGTLTIAAADETKIGLDTLSTGNLRDTLFLKDAAGTQISNVAINTTFAQVGESIMVIPEGDNTNHAKYTMYLGVTQTDGTVQHHELRSFTIDFDDLVDKDGNPILNKYAEAGKMYVVRLVIYGFEKIEMTVSLEDWEYGGETQIDPDQDTRPATTITVKDSTNTNNLTAIEMAIGEIYNHINATAVSGSNLPTPLFSSSNKKVATVDATGKVTGVSAGTCKIYVYVNGDDDYQGALAAVDVTVLPTPTVTAAITKAAAAVTEWNFNNVNAEEIGTIAGSATVGGNPVAGGAWTYEVSDNAYFTVNANTGVIVTKDLTGVSAPGSDVVVTFTAKLAASAGNYAAGQQTATITVHP